MENKHQEYQNRNTYKSDPSRNINRDSESDSDHEYKIDAVENLSDWKIHHDDPDIRGWNVVTSTGEKIGEVDNLIASTLTQKVIYAEIELDKNIDKHRDLSYRDRLPENHRMYYGNDDDRHILVPIGMVYVEEDDKTVIASKNLKIKNFANSPRYRGVNSTRIIPAYELSIMRYHADQDDNYRDAYNDKKYDFEGYRNSPYISDKNFYNSDFFSRDRYLRRYQANNTTMASVDTGSNR